MTGKPKSKGGDQSPQSREDRLKAALKANMAKRKAQARARKATGPGTTVQTDAKTKMKE